MPCFQERDVVRVHIYRSPPWMSGCTVDWIRRVTSRHVCTQLNHRPKVRSGRRRYDDDDDARRAGVDR